MRIDMCEFQSLAAESLARHLRSAQTTSGSWMVAKSIHVCSRTSEDWFSWPRGMSDDGEKAIPATTTEQIAADVFLKI